MIKSPLNYTGGKHKLLPQILPYLPNDIDTFVDLFCGGCNVAVNVDADHIICNDIEYKIIELYKYFRQMEISLLVYLIHKRIKEFHLTIDSKENYLAFRKFYNQTKHPLDLFILICFSFSHHIRFNNKGEYNNPSGAGKSAYNPTLEANLTQFVKAVQHKSIAFYNYDFMAIHRDAFTSKHFIFCDPPYAITYTNYGLAWDEEHERGLYEFLDIMNKKNIRFMLTNVTRHKGSVNKLLLDFSRKFRTIELNSSYANSSYHTKRETSKEIMVVNY